MEPEEVRFNLNPKVGNPNAEIKEINGDLWLCLEGTEDQFYDIWVAIGEMFDFSEDCDD